MTVHLARGTRDFLPESMHKRNHVIDIIARAYRLCGFEPLMTPAFERIETLTGKYGEDGQQLIFRILKRGEGGKRGEVDQALRYDLTVPLARVIAMNPQLRLPFKRYQIAPVWRADRPAKGRFREFLQCDADLIGSTSPLAEAECLFAGYRAMADLGLTTFRMRLNDRRILSGIAAEVGASEQETAFLVILDKLDKIGRSGVSKELATLGLGDATINRLWVLLEPQSSNSDTLAHIKSALCNHPEAVAAADVLTQVIEYTTGLGMPEAHLTVDLTLARGLDYYTGPVFETVIDGVDIGSVGAGGRYDGLIGMFSNKSVPAVGYSIGFARILVAMEELGLLEDVPKTSAQVLIALMDTTCEPAGIRTARELRTAGIATDLYTGSSKLRAQFKYANAKGYQWIAVIGPSEADKGEVNLKNMMSGLQVTIDMSSAAAHIQQNSATL